MGPLTSAIKKKEKQFKYKFSLSIISWHSFDNHIFTNALRWQYETQSAYA